MPISRYGGGGKPELVVRTLTQADRLLADGNDVAGICHELGGFEPTHHRRRNQIGGLKADDAETKKLERENATPGRGDIKGRRDHDADATEVAGGSASNVRWMVE